MMAIISTTAFLLASLNPSIYIQMHGICLETCSIPMIIVLVLSKQTLKKNVSALISLGKSHIFFSFENQLINMILTVHTGYCFFGQLRLWLFGLRLKGICFLCQEKTGIYIFCQLPWLLLVGYIVSRIRKGNETLTRNL